jgi:hypothetical protein
MNSNSVYFQTVKTQPYHIFRCALYLKKRGIVSNISEGINYLYTLEKKNPEVYKHLISSYMEDTSFRVGYIVNIPQKNIYNRNIYGRTIYGRSYNVPYGENYMNWSK